MAEPWATLYLVVGSESAEWRDGRRVLMDGGLIPECKTSSGNSAFVLFTDRDLARRHIAKENPSFEAVEVGSPEEMRFYLERLLARGVTHGIQNPFPEMKDGQVFLIRRALDEWLPRFS